MILSKNLSLAEVMKSATAIKHGIANEPNSQHLTNLKAVATNIFQPCRDYFGKPLAVTSGYRSPELNDLIGGSKRSQHSKGEALDLDAQVYGGFTNAELFHYIKDNLDFDQLIWEFGTEEEPDWIHCSYTTNNRGEVLRAYRHNGKTRYGKL
jgi:zinc D-Ala-D-Ala carboxypeptidase